MSLQVLVGVIIINCKHFGYIMAAKQLKYSTKMLPFCNCTMVIANKLAAPQMAVPPEDLAQAKAL